MSNSPTETNGRGTLGLWDAVSIIVGIVIGTTIYKAPQVIFAFADGPWWALGVWVLGGLVALVGAFCYAELATTYPKAGGDYYYLSKGVGPTTGFLFGWAQLTVVMPASIGVMAYAFADFFLKEFYPDGAPGIDLPLGDHSVRLDPYFAICTIVVVALTITNILGVFVGKTVQNLLTIAKVLGVGTIIVCGLCWGNPEAWDYTSGSSGTPALGSLAIILVLYAYGGWNDSAFVAAEVRNPKRNIPRALFIGLGIIVVVYVLVNAAYINSIGWNEIRSQNNKPPLPRQVVAGSPLQNLGGNQDWGAMAMSLLIMVSALGAANGLTFTGARVYATLGADHRLFGWMGHWRPGRGAPIMALILQALLTVFIVAALTTQEGRETINEGLGYINKGFTNANEILQSVGVNWVIQHIPIESDWQPGDGFETLVARTAPVFWFFFMMTGFSLFLLRERFKSVLRPYSVPFYPVVPIIFCCSCAWMLYQSIDYVKWHALFAVVVVLLGLPFYWLSMAIWGLPADGPLEIGMPVSQVPEQPRPKNWR